MGLLINIKGGVAGDERSLSFDLSTVRIGRNASNEIVLDKAFVSQFHVQISQQGNGIQVMDLGSTNGTSINGYKLHPRAPVQFTSLTDEIQIGDLHITVSFTEELRTEISRVERAPTRGPQALGVRIVETTTGETQHHIFDSSPIRIGRNNLNELVFPQGFVSQWHALIRFSGGELHVMDLGSTNGTIVNGQRLAARTATTLRPKEDTLQIGSISIQLEFTAPVKVAVQVPSLAPSSEDTALFFDAARWLCNLRGEGVTEESRKLLQVGPSMDRVELLLQTFGRSYIELRNGFEQFGKEMGINVATESSPLHDAQTGSDVLNYLIDWEAGDDRVERLRRAYTDLALHQVALLNGVMSGVRELLREMAPDEKGWRPFTSGDVEKKRQELLEEDRFSRIVFGKAFARAYFEVTGGKLEPEK